jgi:hypothetical protein
MYRKDLFVPTLIAALAVAVVPAAVEGKEKSGHKFKGSLELQYRTNNNIGVAPSSQDDFDFADLADFGDDDAEDAEGGEESEEEDDFEGDGFDDIVDADPDEDEIEEDDAIDEDGDGIDDIIDPNADSVVDSESRVTTKLGLGHKYKFAGGGMSWNNGAKISIDRHGDRDDLDKLNWAVTTGLEFAPKGSKHAFKPSISYVTLEKNDSEFVNTFVLSLDYDYEVSKRLGLSATYNYQDKDIVNPDSPDARIDTLALSAEFKATDDDIFKLKVAPKVEDSTKVTRNTDAQGWEITYTRKLPWDMTAGIGYKFDTIEHKNLEPKREDDNTTVGLQLGKDFGKQFSAALGYETRERRSNIPGKDADNESVYIEGTWKF